MVSLKRRVYIHILAVILVPARWSSERVIEEALRRAIGEYRVLVLRLYVFCLFVCLCVYDLGLGSGFGNRISLFAWIFYYLVLTCINVRSPLIDLCFVKINMKGQSSICTVIADHIE